MKWKKPHKEPKKNRFGCGICYPPLRRARRAKREREAMKHERKANG